MNKLRKVGLIIAIALALSIALFKPFAGLAPQGHYILAVIIVTLALWIFRDPTLPYFAGGCLLLAGGLVFQLPLGYCGKRLHQRRHVGIDPGPFFWICLGEDRARETNCLFGPKDI